MANRNFERRHHQLPMADMNVVFTPDDLAAQKAIHDVLDPHDLCNPGKIFPAAPAEADRLATAL